jgi:hypothetical protein
MVGGVVGYHISLTVVSNSYREGPGIGEFIANNHSEKILIRPEPQPDQNSPFLQFWTLVMLFDSFFCSIALW